VAERPAQPLGEIGHAGELPVLHDAVRDPQPAHVGILRRRHIEQAVIAPAKIIRRARRRVVKRLLFQPRIRIERMLLALELLLIGQFLARSRDLVLRFDMRGIRSGRLSIRFPGAAAAEAAPDAADLQSGSKAFEIALLLVGKVDCERFDFHGARRSSCGHDRWRQRMVCDRLETAPWCRAVVPNERSDQLRCCGNPSWTWASRHLRQLAALHHSSCVPKWIRIKYCGISNDSETQLETMKQASLLLCGQIA
jgi:hypothetical protein